jgi:hypothetical protein
MASFKGYDRSEGQKRRQGLKKPRRQGIPRIEFLENRQLLTGSPTDVVLLPIWTPTDTNLLDAQNGPMANLGATTVDVYKTWLDSGGNSSALASEFPALEFQNGMVGLSVKSLGGDFNQFVSELTNAGLSIVDTSATYGIVDGYAPINELPTIAELPQTQSGQIAYTPVAYASSEYQGTAYNEAETAMFADAARTQFGVDGTGETIGVLSTSVNQYQGGLSESYGTGDLNPNNPVLVLQDNPAEPTDEGRAMLENIHDIAPGANLQFATGFVSQVSMASNIEALQKAGSNIIVDDVGYFMDPMFQDGIIAQAINTVTSEGVSYFSSAGNEGPDSGYLSTFRQAAGTITGIGTGTFMNFNPNGGTNLEMPVTTTAANAEITFEYDQPYQFEEPAGSPGKVTSNVNIYVINAATGAVVVGAAQNQNNVAAQQPLQLITIPAAGSYYIAVQVISGANPGHIEFVGDNDTNGFFTVNSPYGTAGNTSYPGTFGHNAAPATIGVGATPWWAPASSLGIGQNPLANEPFSSSGPGLQVFTATGVALTTPVTVDNPSITAADGGTTTFFDPAFGTLNTATPPLPGQPASSVNLVPTSQQGLPVFFGTSSAAPNAAAVAALMLEEVPGLTPTEVRSAMETSAVAMNGQTQGTWVPADGFGFLNAINAVNAVDLLRVSSTNPANGSTVSVSPSVITVTFNKPVNFATVAAGDLTFLTEPSGVTVKVGTPIAVGSSTFPSIIQFPISFSKPAGTLANGAYSFSIQSISTANPVESEDGKDLVPSGTIKFTLADTTSPVITNTTISGRTVTITFSKAIDPSTVNLSNIFVLRQGSNAAWPPTVATLGNYTNLNSDPRTVITYNPQNFTVTLNYSALPQTELPSDKYAIVVLSPTVSAGQGVTDLVGNPLFGLYSGVFPTGNGEKVPQDFIQNLGPQSLSAPIITTFVMTPTATNDTGIVGDQNTNISNPQFIGQIFAPFPGTVAGLLVYIEFASLHGGTTTLAVGGGGRGFTGTYDQVVTTTSTGSFTVNAPGLLQGFQSVVAVVVGQPDDPPLPGLASTQTDSFRIDLTAPQVTGASFVEGGASLPLPNGPSPNITPIPSLTSLTLNIVDPVTQSLPTLVTPSTVIFDALNPATAQNISNYSLINTSENDEDESQFIATATFVATSPTLNAGANNYVLDYNGFVNLTFLPGLPAGIYTFVAHTTELQYPGLTDAADNPLDDTHVPGEGTKDFIINFDIQPEPVYITSMALESGYNGDGSTVIGTQQSFFELPPTTGTNTRDNVLAPPTAVVVDFSNPLPLDATAADGSLAPIDYANDLQLIKSANNASGASDGDFGNLGQGGLGSTGAGFSLLTNYTVSLYSLNVSTDTWSLVTTAGESGTRLVLQLDPGSTLTADDYRVYVPNQVNAVGANTVDSRIFDIYGNQLDGENLGNQTSQASPDFNNPAAPVAIPNYEDLQSDGTNRQDDMSGDGVAGGAFMSGFTVVPYGNVVYARPDYVENPLVPSTLSNGSLANPYPVLAPEGNPNSSLAANPTHNPNLGLNNPKFFNPGALASPNPYDFSGDGLYEQSALYAASQLAFNGPVVVVALPAIPQRSPVTGDITQAAFVLQAPAGNNGGVTNGSASVPYNTTLVLAAGSTLKLQNADLYVQNQGSALQAQGTASNPVNFTSYNDATVGGATNNNPDTNPFAGDWGGIVFRNYDQAVTPTVTFPVDGTLVGFNGSDAISGASDVMSILNNANIRYAGGAVPQGSSNFFSAVTLFDARPTLSNMLIADTGGTGGTEAAIAADMDSFREDDSARGPLIRQVDVLDNSLNGLYLISETNGFIEPTNAMPYPTNPSTLGGSQNYTFFEPLPFLVLAQLVLGQEFLDNTGGQTQFIENRLYIQPGVIIKFNTGSALDVLNPGASLNVGSRSYINGFDQNNQYSPDSPNFVDESASDPQALFTSLFDDTAISTLVPDPINATGETAAESAAKLVPGAWGSVGIQSGAIAVINAATFKWGGGAINTPHFTMLSQSVLAFITAETFFTTGPGSGSDSLFGLDTLGTHAYITNNNFFDNFDSAMQIEPNGLMSGNTLTPLAPVNFTDPFDINNIGGGSPFFRGNVMSDNGIDGMSVVTNRGYYVNPGNNFQFVGPREAISVGVSYVNQTVNAVWNATDLTYVLRGTVVLAGAYDFENFDSTTGFGFDAPVPNLQSYTTETAPVLSLTIQSALPGTVLADGTTIPSPGQSVIVKLLNDNTPNDSGPASLASTFGSSGSSAAVQNAGAGWVVGVDDGVDPPAANEGFTFSDPGAYSEIRILGIPGNQTTGQQQVPVIITSLRDGTVGTTVRGVVMDNILNSDPIYTTLINPGATLDTPAAGDGGYLYIGSNSLTEYDPTNPFDGSIVSNADISYMTRIEVQGGGIIDSSNSTPATPGAPTLANTDWYNTLTGYLDPTTQINSAMMFTIADSNLSDFSDAAVFVHPEALNALYRDWTGLTSNANPPLPARGGLQGEPVDLYMYNDTISNSNQGVHINSTTGDQSTGNTVYQAVLLNNTFYNDTTAIQTLSPQFNGQNPSAAVVMLVMNNIFDGSTGTGIDLEGQDEGTQLQYNLFFANTVNIIQTSSIGVAANVGPTFGDPDFVGPVGAGAATGQNFELEPNSPAINAARSEIGPNLAGNSIYPTITFQNTFGATGGTLIADRTDPNSLSYPQEPGRDLGISDFAGEFFGGFEGDISDPSQIVTLPGSGFFNFPDEWEPVLTTDPSGYSTTYQADGTYNYAPISGQRDLLGYIRAPQPGSTGTGYGSNPFIDVGAYQYVNLHPPQVTGVTETPTQGATPVNFYTVGGISGVNQTPWTINITFNGPISPSTINANTVSLVDLGSNPSQPLDQDINLAGKLSYNSATDTLIINLAAAGLTLGTDAYQITLFGSGSPVITNLQGVALDGENTVGGTPTGAQLALPSGNGYPGGNFFDSFIINTTPPTVEAGSLAMSPASDTNIVGDNITTTNLPTFNGTVSEPNPQLVPVAGQTVILDIGIEFNGVTYFSTTGAPANLIKFIRPNAGTATSTTGGAFAVTVGADGANTGLVTNTTGLPDLTGTYSVGVDGVLSPLPGDDNGYYVARVRIIDQSGNQSNPSDPNAQVPFIVDDTAPTLAVTSPTAGQVLTSVSGGVLNFTVTTSQNIDLTSFNASSITLINAGPDGILGTSDDVTIPIDTSTIKVTYLNKGTGGPGAESISFSSLVGSTLTNNLYQITFSTAIKDIAGNTLQTAVTQTFAVFAPSLAQNLFVEEGADATTATGTRENPYATISAAMTAASAGDVIAVLPGVYQEQVTMKQFVRLYSAATTSTDSTVFTTSTGDALSTIIRAPFVASPPAGTYATITASGLESLPGLTTEIAGFTIASPLIQNPASGLINPNSVAVSITNSNITLDKDYVIDGGVGVLVMTGGSGATSILTPAIYNDGIIGNVDGLVIDDLGSTPSNTTPASVINNDFAFNTVGLLLENSASSPNQAYVASNIFWENHDQSLLRNGFAIFSQNVNKVSLQNNLFYGNGTSDTNQSGATNNLGNGFSPALLGTTAAAAQSNLGNFVGNPSFVFPIDPRPGSDGPANFYIDADFQVTSISAAIDNAWEATAKTTDFLGNSQVYTNGGLGISGNGPRDIGAFEFNGTGGQAVGGSFRVVTTSLVPVSGATVAGGTTKTVFSSPTEITVTFSGNVNPSDISATDLVLSGSAINPAAPAHATSLTWIDAHTVEFNLAGQFISSGTVDISIAAGSVQSATGNANAGYSDHVILKIAPVVTPTPTPTPTSTSTPTPTSTSTPAPAPKPVPKGPLHKAKAVIHHIKKVVKHVVPKPKAKPKPKPKAKPIVHKVEPKVVHKAEVKKKK